MLHSFWATLYINRLYSYFIKFSTLVWQGGKIKLFNSSEKPFIVISFRTQPVPMKFWRWFQIWIHYWTIPLRDRQKKNLAVDRWCGECTTFAPATIAPVINTNVKHNSNPNPNPNPNLNSYPSPNPKPNHYPHSNSLLPKISWQGQLSPEQMSDHRCGLLYMKPSWRRDGPVVRATASRPGGHGFEPRSGNTKDFKNGTYCLLVRCSAFKNGEGSWTRVATSGLTPYCSFHCI